MIREIAKLESGRHDQLIMRVFKYIIKKCEKKLFLWLLNSFIQARRETFPVETSREGEEKHLGYENILLIL